MIGAYPVPEKTFNAEYAETAEKPWVSVHSASSVVQVADYRNHSGKRPFASVCSVASVG